MLGLKLNHVSKRGHSNDDMCSLFSIREMWSSNIEPQFLLLNDDDVIKWKHFGLLAQCAGNSPVTGEFPSQRPVTRSFDVFFDLSLNKWLSKQSKRRWFETPSRSLWHHLIDVRIRKATSVFDKIYLKTTSRVEDFMFMIDGLLWKLTDNIVAETPVKFQSNPKNQTANLVALKLEENVR